MKTILDDANKNYYAIPAINVINMELARGVVNAAIAENSPLILNISELQFTKHAHLGVMAPMAKYLAETAPVPIAVNLDHGKTWEAVTHAYRSGFSSIMIDASLFDMEKNIAMTREVVHLCHPQGISVEAELGHVGVAMNGDDKAANLFTRPEDVVYFLQHTDVDALAVAVGSAHGNYPAGYVPTLHFDIIREIKKAADIPLVLHGGSGSGDENLALAAEAGINKVNIATDMWNTMRDYMAKALRENAKVDLIALLADTQNAVQETAAHFMRVLKSSGNASHFTWEALHKKNLETKFCED